MATERGGGALTWARWQLLEAWGGASQADMGVSPTDSSLGVKGGFGGVGAREVMALALGLLVVLGLCLGPGMTSPKSWL